MFKDKNRIGVTERETRRGEFGTHVYPPRSRKAALTGGDFWHNVHHLVALAPDQCPALLVVTLALLLSHRKGWRK